MYVHDATSVHTRHTAFNGLLNGTRVDNIDRAVLHSYQSRAVKSSDACKGLKRITIKANRRPKIDKNPNCIINFVRYAASI